MKGETNPLTGACRLVNAPQFSAFGVFSARDIEALPVSVPGVPAFLAFLFAWERHCSVPICFAISDYLETYNRLLGFSCRLLGFLSTSRLDFQICLKESARWQENILKYLIVFVMIQTGSCENICQQTQRLKHINRIYKSQIISQES